MFQVESSARASWAQLKQIALVDEQVELYGSGDEAFLMEPRGLEPKLKTTLRPAENQVSSP